MEPKPTPSAGTANAATLASVCAMTDADIDAILARLDREAAEREAGA